MNFFELFFYKKYVETALYPIPMEHWKIWHEALTTFPSIDTLSNISSVPRRKQICLIVLHHSGSLEFNKALRWFGNPNTYTSTSYLIDLDGYTLCLVPEDRGALHCPNATYNHSRLVNEMSIGVTLVGNGTTPFTDAQYEAVAMLCVYWKRKYELTNEDIKKHSDIPLTNATANDPTPWDQQRFLKEIEKFENI